jgi:hypothetical protein
MDPTLWEQSQTNLADFLRSEWLPAIRSSVRETTFANYVSHVDCHLIPGIGVLALGEIDGRRLNAFYAGLLSEGRVDGKGALAPSSVRRIHAALHKALADAVRWGYLSDNPADAADPPKLRALAPKEMTTWTAQELRSFLDCAHDDPLYPLWFVLATTGMRRGEALGCRPDRCSPKPCPGRGQDSAFHAQDQSRPTGRSDRRQNEPGLEGPSISPHQSASLRPAVSRYRGRRIEPHCRDEEFPQPRRGVRSSKDPTA